MNKPAYKPVIGTKKKKVSVATIVIICFLSIVALLQIFPFYLQIVTSLHSQTH